MTADPSESVPGGSERVLVVDDEESIVGVTQKMLELLGYRVISFTNGLEALAVFRARPHAFDLVLSDQTMPGLTGFDLARQLLAIRSEIPIILCSGYSSVKTREKALGIGIREVVTKPVARSELAQTIRRVLGETGNPAFTAD